MRRALALVAVAMTLLGIAIACGTSPVIVGKFECEIPEAGDNTHGCRADEFCATSICSSTAGQCEKIDADGCAKGGYECGCDGITYYNGCLREEARVTRAAKGQCSGPGVKSCYRDNDCPGNGRCASIFETPLLFEAGANLGPFEGGFPDPFDGGLANLFEGGFPDPFDGGSPFDCRGVELVEQYFPKVCWALPAADASTRSLLRTFCTGCDPDLAAIRMGGFLFTCPSPDLSDD